MASPLPIGPAPTGPVNVKWMNQPAMQLLLPLPAMVLSMAVLPRLSPKSINLPNREYWLDPARRDTTLRYIEAHACWLGSLMTVFIAAIHLLLIEANATQPPRLPGALFATLLAAFLAALALWMVTLIMHFRRRN